MIPNIKDEQYYKTLMNSSPDMVFVSRIDDLRFTDVNDRACEFYGFSREEFLSMSLLDIEVDPLTHAQIRASYDTMDPGQPLEVFGTNVRKDGSVFPVQVRFTKIDESYALANVRDVTEQNAIDEIGRILTSTLDIQDVYLRFASELKQLVDFDQITITSIDKDQRTISIRYSSGLKLQGRDQGESLPFNQSQSYETVKFGPIFRGHLTTATDINPIDKQYLALGFKSFAILPLMSRGRLIGTIGLRSCQEEPFRPAEQALLKRLADQIAPAVENANLYEESTSRTSQLECLVQLAGILGQTRPIEEKLLAMLEQLLSVADGHSAFFRVPDAKTGELILTATAGVPDDPTVSRPTSLGEGSLVFEVYQQGKPLVINDYQSNPKASSMFVRWGAESIVFLPILVQSQPAAVVTVSSQEQDHFTPERVRLLTAIGEGLGALLENSLLSDDLMSKSKEMAAADNTMLATKDELALTDEIGRIIASNLDIDEVFEKFAIEAKRLLDFDRVIIGVFDRDTGTILIRYSDGPIVPGLANSGDILIEGTASQTVLETGQPIFRSDITENPRFSLDKYCIPIGFVSQAVLPLTFQAEHIGVLALLSRRKGAFEDREQSILTRLAGQIAPAVGNSILYQKTLDAQEVQRRMTEEMALVDRVATIITFSTRIEEVYDEFSKELKKLVGFDRIVINVIHSGEGKFSARFISGLPVEGREQGFLHDIEGTFVNKVLQARKTIVRDDCQDECVADSDHFFFDAGLVASIGIPLVNHYGIVATLHFHSKRIAAFGPQEQIILERLAEQITPSIINEILVDEIRNSHAKANAVLETAADGIITINREGQIESVNPAIEEIFGYMSDEILGENFEILLPGAGERGHDVFLQPFLRGSESRGFDRETEGLCKDGSTIPVEMSVGFNEIGEGKIFTVIIRDITSRKIIEAGLNETARLASIGELAAGVAHEINNPLAIVKLGSELLSQYDLPEDALVDLNRISEAADRAARIVQNLQLFARQQLPNPEPTNIGVEFERILELKVHDLRLNNIETRIHIDKELPNCLIDRHQWSQVVINLLNNAEQALSTREDSRIIKIDIDSAHDDVTMVISDNGSGIDPEILNRIFEPFFTTKEPGQGTGLGLSICHGIIQQHGGEMWAANGENGGSSFFIKLPIFQEDLVSEDALVTPEATSASIARILIVDDEAAIRDLLARSLQRDGNAVDQAGYGDEALRMMKESDYDCIVLDLKMPGMSGMEVYERSVKDCDDFADRFVFMTGDTASPESASFLSGKTNPVLSKPFNTDDLKHHIGIVTARLS